MKTIRKDMAKALWELFSWVNFFEAGDIRITGTNSDKFEFCLENRKANFMYNFSLYDLKAIRGLNKLLCMWANKGIIAQTDYNNKNIFDIELSEINSG